MVDAMVAGGVEVMFFASGSDVMVFQEEICRRQEQGLPAPRLVPVLHEAVGLNAASGYAMATQSTAADAAGGDPPGMAALALHADVGLLNAGAAWHTARRAGVPVLVLAGSPPTSAPGTRRGARDHPVYWLQEPVDQRTLVRPYVKWDWRLSDAESPRTVVRRAVQLARQEPPGTALLTLPRDVIMADGEDPAVPTGPVPAPGDTYPDPERIEQAATLLVRASRPMIVTGSSGRDPRTVPVLTALAETLGATVTDNGWRERLNMPSTHPLLQTDASLGAADAVLVVDRLVPWVPDGRDGSPPAGTPVVWLGRDVTVSDIPVFETVGDVLIPCLTLAGLTALLDAVRRCQRPAERAAAGARRQAAGRRRAEVDARRRTDALAAAAPSGRIAPARVILEVTALLDEQSILIDEAVSASPLLRELFRGDRPGCFFAQSGSGGGWGSGAALGAKLAEPGRDVVLVSGDGFYWFGAPGAAVWTARHAGAAYLAVVLVNGRYSTGTVQVSHFYPGGFAERAGFPGGVFDPPPDYAAEARAAGGWGATVTDPESLAPTLAEGLRQSRQGIPAVVAVRVD